MKKSILLVLLLLALLPTLIAQQSQNEIGKSFKSGDYKVFKIKDGQIVAITKSWPIKFIKSGENISKVEVNRAGVLLEEFIPDLEVYPAYFAYEDFRLTMKDKLIFYYEWRKENAYLKYIFTQGEAPSSDAKTLTTELEKYALATFKNQQDDRANLAANQAKQEEADRIANSLKNKNVQSIRIKIIDTPNEFGHRSQLKYGLEATTVDGKVYKTKNLGGKTAWDDFKVTATGGEVGEEQIAVQFDCSKIPSDQVLITASSKYHPHIKDSKAINIKYNEPVVLNYNGASGRQAPSFTVKAAKTTHKQTGEALIKLEIINDGRVLHRLKVTPSTQVVLNAYGGGGTYGGSSSLPTKGGNGGNVTFIKDPSVGSFSIIVNNAGGRGGSGSNGIRDAPNGAKGTFYTKTQAVNLAW